MRFHFCGGADCPEWVLSEIVLLNQISAVRLRLFVSQIIKKLTDVARDEQLYEEAKAFKYLDGAGLNEDQSHTVFALIDFIVSSAACHRIDDAVLLKELQQMGLAIENSEALVKPFKNNQAALVDAQERKMPRVSQIQQVRGRVVHVLGHSAASAVRYEEEKAASPKKEALDDEEEAAQEEAQFDALGARVELSLKLKGVAGVKEVGIEGRQFLRFLKELRAVRDTLEAVSTS